MALASARHILVEDKKECEAIKQQLAAGGDFAALAFEHSLCPSGQEGGALGEFSPGQMVPEFDRVVFTAPVGVVQGPVRTQFGWHLVEVTDRSE
jgi:peptidyl-prolyl cis-trans isomerase C